MSGNPIYIRANALLSQYRMGISDIVSLNQLLPHMQETAAGLQWIVNSLPNSPSAVNQVTDEKLIDFLDKAQADAAILASLHKATFYLGPVAASTAGTVTYEYSRYVKIIEHSFYDQPQVVAWAVQTQSEGDKLEAIKQRSERAGKRLAQLLPELASLHKEAVATSLLAKDNPLHIVGAASILDRLLERFKGELYGKCRGDITPPYHRIAEYLAANSQLTKEVVREGQNTYNRLNQELVPVRKSDKSSTGDRMVQLLRELEEHIIEITSALDPEKLRVTFAN